MHRKFDLVLVMIMAAFFGIVAYELPKDGLTPVSTITENFATKMAASYKTETADDTAIADIDALVNIAPAAGEETPSLTTTTPLSETK